jgi:hypothetical protein
MLVLTMRPDDYVSIGDDIWVKCSEIKHSSQAKIVFIAPKEIPILRDPGGLRFRKLQLLDELAAIDSQLNSKEK